jgi:hypothetical protein
MLCLGGASRRHCFSFISDASRVIAPVFFKFGCERIAPDTHMAQAVDSRLSSPWQIYCPRRTLVPLRVQCVVTFQMVAGLLTPILYWLTSQAIRFAMQG